MKTGFLALHGKERDSFYQAKYEYYRKFQMCVVVISCLASISYFISDCQLFGRFAYETLLSRTIILIPMLLYLIAYRKVSNYKLMGLLSYLVAHAIVFCTEWSVYYLEDQSHAPEGIIVFHLIFMALSYAAPFSMGVLSHAALILDIILANTFLHYRAFDVMISLNLPCVISVAGVSYFLTNVYLEQYRTKHKLEDSMVRDPLTKLFNRHKMEDLIRDKAFMESLGNNISVMMMDVDHFKKINDHYGHEKGDAVLKRVAELIKNHLRSEDYIIRWGGEEFVAIMPNCPINHAVRVAERTRNAIAEDQNGIKKVSISIGVSQYDGMNYMKVIDEADKALYQAKTTGRNKVVAYEDTMKDMMGYTGDTSELLKEKWHENKK